MNWFRKKRVLWTALSALAGGAALWALDRDGGGISDVWEAHWLTGTLNATEDPDADGYNNLMEYYFNTNPLNPQSRPRIDIVSPEPIDIQVYFFAPMGQRFDIEANDDLLTGNWTVIHQWTGNNSTLVHTEEPSMEKHFFRVIPQGSLDVDGDYLDAYEESLKGTHPALWDTDGNGIGDGTVIGSNLTPYTSGMSAAVEAGGNQTVYYRLVNTGNTTREFRVVAQGNRIPPYYNVEITDTPGGNLTYQWQDISATGTWLEFLSTESDVYEEVGLSFSFPFYGNNYTSAHLCNHGYITFGHGEVDYYNDEPLPNPYDPSNMLAVFFHDLDAGSGGDVYFQDFGTHAIIQWEGIYPYADPSGNSTYTFQAVLGANGTMECRYQEMTGVVEECTVGLQNQESTEGLSVAYWEPFIENQLAVRFTPREEVWFSVSPEVFTLGPGEERMIALQIETPSGMAGTIEIRDNATEQLIDRFVFSLAGIYTDTDGDWQEDDYETAHGLSPYNAADAQGDLDNDGLSNRREFSAGTDPEYWDSDGDLLPDGWEFERQLNPRSSVGADGSFGDYDADGLHNLDEWLWNVDPRKADTDGDGTSDGIEAASGSDPSNPSDGGQPPPEDEMVTLYLEIGDHSGSHSERYLMTCTPVGEGGGPVIKLAAEQFGVVTPPTPKKFRKGFKYTVTITHMGTSPAYTDEPRPDYDYTAEITGEEVPEFILNDPQGIMGAHNESESFYASGKQAEVIVLKVNTETTATVPSDRTRKKVGVGEQVMLTLQPPSLVPISWSISGNGTLTATSGNPVTFTAPDRASASNITATYGSGSCSVSFTVVEPNGAIIEQESGTGVWHVEGQASVGFKGRPYIKPDDVSFGNIEFREGSCEGFGEGYFSSVTQPHDDGEWGDVGDLVPGKGSIVNGVDTIQTGPHGAPYIDGTFTWSIPWYFRVGTGAEKQFTTVIHQDTINSAGNMSISKGGTTKSAALSNPSSNY